MPQYNEISVNKDSEFFMAVATRDRHSFLLLGVIDQGIPQTLARIGKRADIDKDSERCYASIKPLIKRTDARITDEQLIRRDEYVSYQAYSITLEQYKQFLTIVAQIDEDQIAYYQNKQVDVKSKEDLDFGMRCFVPNAQPGNLVTFQYKEIADLKPTYTLEVEDGWENIITPPDLNAISQSNKATHLTMTNNCRTFARSIMEQIIGVGKKISGFYLSDLSFNTTLQNSNPNKQSFYVLPNLPSCSEHASDKKKRVVLENLYAKLEKIPKTAPDSEKTRAKFDSIKALYKKIAGNVTPLTAEQLLVEIQTHYEANKTNLHAYRKNGFGKFFGFATDTEKLFKRITKSLEKDKASETDNPVVDPKIK